MKKILVLLMILLTTQIIVFAEHSKSVMNNVMQSWEGQNIESVINMWGQPSQIDKLYNNGKKYYWKQVEYMTTATGKSLYEGKNYCTKVFETDEKGNIVYWEYKGASCPKQRSTGARYINPNLNNDNNNNNEDSEDNLNNENYQN